MANRRVKDTALDDEANQWSGGGPFGSATPEGVYWRLGWNERKKEKSDDKKARA